MPSTHVTWAVYGLSDNLNVQVPAAHLSLVVHASSARHVYTGYSETQLHMLAMFDTVTALQSSAARTQTTQLPAHFQAKMATTSHYRLGHGLTHVYRHPPQAQEMTLKQSKLLDKRPPP